LDEDGNHVAVQPLEIHSDGTYWAIWVEKIPAFGYKKFIIREAGPEQAEPSEVSTVSGLENQWYKVTIDTESAALSSLYDKDLDMELVDQGARWKLGQFIYETLGNRSQMEAFYLNDYKREPLDSVWFERYEEGDIWNTVYFKGNTKAANRERGYEFEIRLFNTAKRLDLAYFIEKKSVTDPEGIYIAFPFRLDDGVLSFDVQGGEIRAGMDQIPGSSNDWNVVQNYASTRSDQGQILISSPEIPMMQFGAINTGRYKAGATPESTHIYGWPMNNYWTTNFNPEQHGGISWIYTISSTTRPSQTEAARFGWGNRIPFLARVFTGGGEGERPWQRSIIQGWPENVMLVSAVPHESGRSCMLHIRETEGESADLATLQLAGHKSAMIRQVNVLGEEIHPGPVLLKPFETKFIRLEW
jgi:hypothetical protein